ncbi:hypothetical protein CRM22_003574 [Opisthorchis felineus]|uniref:Uncharacterized protein n=1 Tax=Opisthorchis felineus TaxID=147828 RepID=A0A4S2M0K1_OPIFE|nr:hypothetical protein CRM22_003574 [Opisthorchis felineus]
MSSSRYTLEIKCNLNFSNFVQLLDTFDPKLHLYFSWFILSKQDPLVQIRPSWESASFTPGDQLPGVKLKQYMKRTTYNRVPTENSPQKAKQVENAPFHQP